jgi:hypothetical protein
MIIFLQKQVYVVIWVKNANFIAEFLVEHISKSKTLVPGVPPAVLEHGAERGHAQPHDQWGERQRLPGTLHISVSFLTFVYFKARAKPTQLHLITYIHMCVPMHLSTINISLRWPNIQEIYKAMCRNVHSRYVLPNALAAG